MYDKAWAVTWRRKICDNLMFLKIGSSASPLFTHLKGVHTQMLLLLFNNDYRIFVHQKYIHFEHVTKGTAKKNDILLL